MKRLGCLVAIIVAVGLLGLAGYGFKQFQRHFELAFDSPYLFVSLGAKPDYQAHFVMWGFQDRGISVFVVTPTQQAAPEFVEELNAPWNHFDSAVWSNDGTVLACRASVVTEEDMAEMARSRLDKGVVNIPGPSIVPYSCPYDFLKHKSIPSPSSYSPRKNWEAHSQAIEQLLKSRGGLGKEVTRREIETHQERLNWTEWQGYKRAMFHR